MKKSFSTVILTAILFILLTVTAFAAYDTGDVNNDSKITPADARLTLRYAVHLDTFTQEQIAAADVNKSGDVTASDARMILRVAAGLDSFASADELNAMLIEPGVLNVAVCADNPPFCYIENGTLKGVDVDVAEKLANSYGLDLKLHNMAYDELVKSVKNNECDIVISITENKNDTIFQLAEQGITSSTIETLLINSYVNINSNSMSIDEFKKNVSKKIGVIKNSLADIVITNDANNGELSSDRIVRYSRYADAYNDLINKKIYMFADEKEIFFGAQIVHNDEDYLNEDLIIFTTHNKRELRKKLESSITSTVIEQIIDSYHQHPVSDSTITCETSSITLAPGGTAVIEASFDSFYGYDELEVKSSPYNINIVENSGKYYLIISIPQNSKSGEVVLCLNSDKTVTHTIKVTVSKASGAKYNFGTVSYCPDFGAYAGVTPEEVMTDTANGAICYIYDAEKLYNAGLTETSHYEKYLELLEKQGFVADSYMTDDATYYMLFYVNEAIEQVICYTEYYYNDGVNVYLTAVSVTVSHQF